MQEISTKPYLLRALYEWCTDNGFTPHIAVRVDNGTRVPRQFVRNDEIVLNISFECRSPTCWLFMPERMARAWPFPSIPLRSARRRMCRARAVGRVRRSWVRRKAGLSGSSTARRRRLRGTHEMTMSCLLTTMDPNHLVEATSRSSNEVKSLTSPA
jgi:hypothetical protein